MIELNPALKALCDVVREAIRTDKGKRNNLHASRRTERANLHHRLMLLVPVYRDIRIFLAQVKTQQSTDDFHKAPERMVSVLLSHFASGNVFVPEDHILWAAPLPRELVFAFFNRLYTSPFHQSRYRTESPLFGTVREHASQCVTLGDFRDALRGTDAATGKPSQTRQMEDVAAVQDLKVRLQSILTPAEFDLLRRHQKLLFA